MSNKAIAAAHWRPAFHLSPAQGLMNDPNGLIHFAGHYHVFFQWNPHACTHGAKSWGHASSPNLLDWTIHPPALEPGDWYDSHGCYSGSAWVMDGRLWLIYTGNVREGTERKSYQCLAVSDDGIHFAKQGPTLHHPPAGYTTHFRDPRLWQNEDGFHMVIGAQRNNGSGTILHFHSQTLQNWTLCGELLPDNKHGYMCECPELFTLQNRQLLLFCPQGPEGESWPYPNANASCYCSMDQNDSGFAKPQLLDYGPDFYAAQTMQDLDGKRIMWGWMGRPEQPHTPSVAAGWTHCLSVPRVLDWHDGQLSQQPHPALQALRGDCLQLANQAISGQWQHPGVHGECCELDITLSTTDGSACHIMLRQGPHCHTRLSWLPAMEELELDTRHSGTGDGRISRAPLPASTRMHLRLLLDRSSLEIFANDGKVVLSACLFPDRGAEGISLLADGSAHIEHLAFWPIKPMNVHIAETREDLAP
ncbi:glycoside hydrolase family 32 protein [Iodobacter ciconiae]|uniref:Sucrose-6-phosphate hydrolase n=1 Tax=Iodobacter ciconiae TaxID=2496266 RepID=A0A3S8ZPJ6_9NEIS|nr:sucrose-6-phosphate hydrolase [Iodobacter ciconiae]AZN35399.1 sucrose-6-phosphate hydrolase [Iodobacter ciconiae]